MMRPFILLLSTLCLLIGGGMALGEQQPAKIKYYDVYLTDNRVCRHCTWRPVDDHWRDGQEGTRGPLRVELINKKGESTLCNVSEILGVDTHPVSRKLLMKSLHGIGLAGPIVVPYAFENAKEYVCKYCDDKPGERD